MMDKKRVIVYVDGYNFYYGLKHGGSTWKRLYWLDIVKFFERMMLPDQELVEVNYYSACPLDDQQAADNQDVLFSANKLNPKFKLHLGRYKKKKLKCQNCGYKIKTYEEKESDVRVATGMLVDMFSQRCDITIVVSADSDMIPSVEIIKSFNPTHPVHAFIPPNQKSFALVSKCDTTVWLSRYKARFVQSMLPDEVLLENGYVLRRPENWR
ncbi:MAG: NYN domain-containing protein [Bacteroidaceae bacterium]|nr:NYN domain-containing protein [Bacteroidaceae bacterium]